MQAKLKILTDNIPLVDDEEEFWDFWIYGPADRLIDVPEITRETIEELRTQGKIDKSPLSILAPEEIAPLHKELLKRAIEFKRKHEKLSEKYQLLKDNIQEVKTNEASYPLGKQAIGATTIQILPTLKMEMVLDGLGYREQFNNTNSALTKQLNNLKKKVAKYYNNLIAEPTNIPMNEIWDCLSQSWRGFGISLIVLVIIDLVLIAISMYVIPAILGVISAILGLVILVGCGFYFQKIKEIRRDYRRNMQEYSHVREEIKKLEEERDRVIKLLTISFLE